MPKRTRRPKKEADTPEAGVSYLSFDEIRSTGLLQELNRFMLHPIGLAAEVRMDGTLTIQDHRSDPEGVVYDSVDADKVDVFKRAWAESVAARVRVFGWSIQPVGAAGCPDLARAVVRRLDS